MKNKIINNLNSLSVIIPFYNEQKRLHLAFKNIILFLKKNSNLTTEILFIDDGSIDKGNLIIKNFFNSFKRNKKTSLKLIKIKKNNGKGYALKKGCMAAKNNWILTSDLDFSVPLTHINKWFKQKLITKNISIYFGSRALKKSKVKSSQYRLFIGSVFRWLIILFLNIRIKDTQCGFKLYKNKTAKKIFKDLRMYGFDHDLEIVLIAKKKYFEIKELPVKWHHVNHSKLSIFKDSLKMFFGILKLSMKK